MPSQGCALLVPGSAWCLNLALGHKGSIFFSHKSDPGHPGFHNLHGLRAPGLFNFQSTGVQIVGKTQRKARATLLDLNDWNRLRAHIARNYLLVIVDTTTAPALYIVGQ